MKDDDRIKGWQARHTLICLGFTGFALFYSLRFNLSIAIVAMVNKNPSTNDNSTSATDNFSNHSELICSELTFDKNDSLASGIPHLSNPETTSFQWNELEQGFILGAFFWGYALTQLPGGLLAQRFGGKYVIGLGLLWAGLLSLILPWAAVIGGKGLVVAVRILQGVGEGLVVPAFVHLLANWTSAKERATLATICFSGMPFGTAVTMVTAGYLISNFGWPSLFYVPGFLTLIWFLLWSVFIYSNPTEHPRISKEERDFIEQAVGSEPKEKLSISDVPWREIFRSVPFWAIFITHFSNVYGLNTLNHEGPKFLHSVLHFEINQNAYIAALPHITQWLFCIIVIKISDILIKKDKLSVGAARKICNTIGQWGTAFGYVGIIAAGCNRTVAVIFFMLSGLFNGACFGGFLINPADISPNYAGAVEGLINGVSNVAGFMAPYVAGLILHNVHSIAGWQYVFMVPMVVNFLGNLVFLIFSSAQVQPWNEKKSRKSP